ncbi:MAG: hypothetical protein KDB58_06925 [Solirubrobacterales bacterium]|nr:hypothetical protein [Solirubrobacterales bacterium]MCB8969750.1 hypothetical protein [Thermoleophilales bacterium]MCO5327155.1 hypothetical protein [Solirubrobacterales bacterium]
MCQIVIFACTIGGLYRAERIGRDDPGHRLAAAGDQEGLPGLRALDVARSVEAEFFGAHDLGLRVELVGFEPTTF